MPRPSLPARDRPKLSGASDCPEGARAKRRWPARLAWAVLLSGGALLAVRASLATVVTVHGDGMAPTIRDGDAIVVLRSGWELGHGDVVVYVPPSPPFDGSAAPTDPPSRGDDLRTPDSPLHGDDDATVELRNVAVVERDDLEQGWRKIQRRTDPKRASSAALRVGRVIAVPGDRISLHTPGAALGLAVNGVPLRQQATEAARRFIKGAATDPQSVVQAAVRSPTYEHLDDRRWAIIAGARGTSWQGLSVPDDAGPIDLVATGYLVLADHRDEGACCDSRALGFVPADHVRGEVVARIRRRHDPDGDPQRGWQWIW